MYRRYQNRVNMAGAAQGPNLFHSCTLPVRIARGKRVVPIFRRAYLGTTNGRMARTKSSSVDRCSTSAITSSAHVTVSSNAVS